MRGSPLREQHLVFEEQKILENITLTLNTPVDKFVTEVQSQRGAS